METPTRAYSCDDYSALIGEIIGTSKWFTLSQSDIDIFADVTKDHQFIHVDPVAAAASPLGGTVAHGFLSLSMLSAMSYDAVPRIQGVTFGLNYGSNRLRFLSPVYAGKRIRGEFSLKSFDQSKPGEVTMIIDVRVDIEDEVKPALVVEWISRHYLETASA